MGLNISGLIAESEFLSLEEVQYQLGIELKESRRSTWEDAQVGDFYGAELMMVLKEGRMLMYFDLDFMQEFPDAIRQFALSAKEAMMFGCSETAMTFVFDWFQFQKPLGEDAYTFEGEFRAHGTNRLKLSGDQDTIFDGLFPYLESKLELEDSSSCVFYTWQKRAYGASLQMDLPKLDRQIQKLLNSKKTDSGLMALQRLRDLIQRKQEAGSSFPGPEVDASIRDEALKKRIYKAAKDWEQGLWNDDTFEQRRNTALIWASRDVDLKDLYSGDYKPRWWR